MQRRIDTIVIHCSASANGDSLFRDGVTPVQAIDSWHAKRGFHRTSPLAKTFNPSLKSIGYHFVIYTNGVITTGRHLDEIGAHVAGSNARSIGICCIGTDKFTLSAWAGLRSCIIGLAISISGNTAIKTVTDAYAAFKAAGISIKGHRDCSPDKDGDGIVEPWEWLKTCPGFDVKTWLQGRMEPLADNIFTGK